jgi:hypothetical protein
MFNRARQLADLLSRMFACITVEFQIIIDDIFKLPCQHVTWRKKKAGESFIASLSALPKSI